MTVDSNRPVPMPDNLPKSPKPTITKTPPKTIPVTLSKDSDATEV
jgi:hypothetical protein